MRYSDSQSQNLLANKALHGLQLGRFASLLEALSVKVLSRSSPSNWFISNKSTVYLSLPNERLSLPLNSGMDSQADNWVRYPFAGMIAQKHLLPFASRR